MPSPAEKMSLNSKGNVSIIHKAFEEKERQRVSGLFSPLGSPNVAQSTHRKGLRKDYMAPTVTSCRKEKPGVVMPSTAVKGTSGWF